MWKIAGYTPDKMKYWNLKGVSLKETQEWASLGIKTLKHKTLRVNKISLFQWLEWQDIGVLLSEAADWINMGFTKEAAQQWGEAGIQPDEAHIYCQANIGLVQP